MIDKKQGKKVLFKYGMFFHVAVSGWKSRDTHAQKGKYLVTCSAHSTPFKGGSEGSGFFIGFFFPLYGTFR